MIIKTCFADCDHARIFRKLAQRRHDVVVCNRLGGSRMNANDCKNIWVFLGELNRATAAFDGCPNRENSRYASLSRAPQDFIEISCEFGIIEVSVSLYEHFVMSSEVETSLSVIRIQAKNERFLGPSRTGISLRMRTSPFDNRARPG